jgi:hypothetical protein
MSKKREDGGPAFPTETEHQSGSDRMHLEGMSLRDYFAGQALGHLSQPIMAAMHSGALAPRREDVARLCYEVADAMLKERQK